jgi:hypothetical protein
MLLVDGAHANHTVNDVIVFVRGMRTQPNMVNAVQRRYLAYLVLNDQGMEQLNTGVLLVCTYHTTVGTYYSSIPNASRHAHASWTIESMFNHIM